MRFSDLNRWFLLPCSKSFLSNRTNVTRLKSLALGAAVFAGSFTNISFQDMQSLANGENRWLVHLPQAPGESVAVAAANMFDYQATNAVAQPARHQFLPQDAKRLTTKLPQDKKPQTVNRKLKGDRVVSASIQRPPAHFSAGSVLNRHSFLGSLDADKKQSLAFVKPKPAKEALKIATAFHAKDSEKKNARNNLPVMVASLVTESKNSILAYSPEPEVKYSPFASVLRDEGPISIIPKLNRDDHRWADDPLPKDSFSAKQQKCLATGIYFEARGEPARGQAAVAQVILNRVRNPSYPNSICGVVYQNKSWRNRCQFSFACDRIRDKVNNKRLWNLAEHIAKETTAGTIWLSQVGSSTHYHATYVNPKWAKHMKRVGKIGLHIFYRTKNGGWS